MRFKFKKVVSILASAAMLCSTVGFAAAAAYPEPLVTSGTANGAVVVGTNAAISDWSAAIDLQQNLNSLVTSSTSTTDASVTGEAAELFSGGTKIYVNDSLNAVKNVLTKADLPTVLAKESFSGNVDATITQSIDIGSNPRITFQKQPTSSDEPAFGLTVSTTQANYIYNASATFSKAVNFSHADSEGEMIGLFGQTFTIGSATDDDTLVLLQSAEKISLDSDSPAAEVVIGGETYTIELVSASDTAATIKVTDSDGNSNTREVDEADSKKIGGVTIAITSADETNLKLSASLVAGSEKVTMEDGNAVTFGESDTIIDGTLVSITGEPGACTKLVISIYASDSDKDAIKAGESFLDPVFGTFKLDFAGLNIPEDSSSREDIVISSNGDDKLDLTFTDYEGNEATVTYGKSSAGIVELMRNDDFQNITVVEGETLHYNSYVVVGNEDEGRLLRVSSVKNSSSSDYSQDVLTFTDVFSGDSYSTTWTGEGDGTVSISGRAYTILLAGVSSLANEEYNITMTYPSSISGTNTAIIYPTIQTSKGAKVGFYEPATINVAAYDGTNALTTLKIPNGDGYTSATITLFADSNYSIDGGVTNLSHETLGSDSITVGQLTYNMTATATANTTTIYLISPGAGGNIGNASLVIFEEKDDNNAYEALVVLSEPGNTGDDGAGIEDVERTWSSDSGSWEATTPSDSKISKEADLWGTVITTDGSDSDQKTAVISYPDEQVYAQLYIAEESAAITPGSVSSGGGGQIVIVKDSEVSSVAGKNLAVVGGSCINTVAAKILGSDTPLCAAAFTDKTGVGAGQYIIKTVASPYAAADSGKIAMLIAGYDAADTVNAVAKALEGATSDVDTEQVYPITATTTA
jgi:uncharacterized Zn-binding protein involved in type VI secretion